jgi:hypothetical protein
MAKLVMHVYDSRSMHARHVQVNHMGTIHACSSCVQGRLKRAQDLHEHKGQGMSATQTETAGPAFGPNDVTRRREELRTRQRRLFCLD